MDCVGSVSLLDCELDEEVTAFQGNADITSRDDKGYGMNACLNGRDRDEPFRQDGTVSLG